MGVVVRVIPLTLLYAEGPIARAYLVALRSAQLRPYRIIRLVPARDAATKKQAPRCLPSALRRRYAARVDELRMMHWPRELRAGAPRLFHAIAREVERSLGFGPEALEAAVAPLTLTDHSDQVEEVVVEGLRDPEVRARLSAIGTGAVLYSGGGIVPRDVLALPGLRMLHVHPGYLPEVRGADGLLWSVLVHGSTGASCFYMAPGIDTGPVVLAARGPMPRFKVGERYDEQTLYRALYSYFDPWLRARTLLDAVGDGADLAALPAVSQDTETGTTYHFMHDRLRRIALDRLFVA